VDVFVVRRWCMSTLSVAGLTARTGTGDRSLREHGHPAAGPQWYGGPVREGPSPSPPPLTASTGSRSDRCGPMWRTGPSHPPT
jgi:hypothetical protein